MREKQVTPDSSRGVRVPEPPTACGHRSPAGRPVSVAVSPPYVGSPPDHPRPVSHGFPHRQSPVHGPCRVLAVSRPRCSDTLVHLCTHGSAGWRKGTEGAGGGDRREGGRHSREHVPERRRGRVRTGSLEGQRAEHRGGGAGGGRRGFRRGLRRLCREASHSRPFQKGVPAVRAFPGQRDRPPRPLRPRRVCSVRKQPLSDAGSLWG